MGAVERPNHNHRRAKSEIERIILCWNFKNEGQLVSLEAQHKIQLS
jgi:hypothetical protein